MNEPVTSKRRIGLLAAANVAVLVAGIAVVWKLGLRFNDLLDDAFISLRYAQNVVRGYGLRFNPGEPPVEGYTNFLWVLIEAMHFPFTRFPEHFILLYNKLCGVLLVAIVWWELRRRGNRVAPWLWLGVGIVALHETVHAWMGGGLETVFYCCLITLGIGRFLDEEVGEAHGLWSAVWFVLAALTRPETYLFIALAWFFMLVRRRSSLRDAFWYRWIRWSLIVGIGCGSHLLFRRVYYDAWVPNTFVAKVPGAYLESGIPYLRWFLDSNYFSWWVAILALGACAALPLRRRKTRFSIEAAFLSACILSFFAYVLYIGGDHFEFRILAPTVPLAALLMPIAVSEAIEGSSAMRMARVSGRGLAVVAGGLLLLRLTWTTLTFPFAEPIWRLGFATAIGQRDADYAERWRPIGEWLRVFARPGERIALPAAGVIPYVSDLPTLDTHGLNDRVVARAPIGHRGVVAHEREASWDYLVEQGVVFHFDDLEIRQAASEFSPAVSRNDARIIARLLTGGWFEFGSTKDVRALRRMLRTRGAIVLAGPDEDAAAIEVENQDHETLFNRCAEEMVRENGQRLVRSFFRGHDAAAR